MPELSPATRSPVPVRENQVIGASNYNALVNAVNLQAYRTSRPDLEQYPILVSNGSGELIPQRGVFSVLGSASEDVINPSFAVQKGPGFGIAVNLGAAIPNNDTGLGYFINLWRPSLVLTDGTPIAGQVCGIKTGTWTVGDTGTGLLCLRNPDVDNLSWVVRHPSDGLSIKPGKTTSVITARSGTTLGSGTVQRQERSGTLIQSDGSPVVTAYNKFASSIANDTYVDIYQDDDGTWWLVSADCP